jgi:hypothetical protein
MDGVSAELQVRRKRNHNVHPVFDTGNYFTACLTIPKE